MKESTFYFEHTDESHHLSQGQKRITVGKPVLKAHLKHGDTVEPCPELVA